MLRGVRGRVVAVHEARVANHFALRNRGSLLERTLPSGNTGVRAQDDEEGEKDRGFSEHVFEISEMTCRDCLEREAYCGGWGSGGMKTFKCWECLSVHLFWCGSYRTRSSLRVGQPAG